MNELVLANRAADWHRLKALVLDSVSSPITRRVYNLGLDEFIAWYGLEQRAGFTKATVNAWRVTLEGQPRAFCHPNKKGAGPPVAGATPPARRPCKALLRSTVTCRRLRWTVR